MPTVCGAPRFRDMRHTALAGQAGPRDTVRGGTFRYLSLFGVDMPHSARNGIVDFYFTPPNVPDGRCF
ncbi:predicted protein [Streptomyces sp. C]|nr:predicted protein [Streptomyces sp. C]